MRFPRALAHLWREALALREEEPRLEGASFEAKVRELEGRLEALIGEGRQLSDPLNARFARRLGKQRRHLLSFLGVEGVEASNNRAERALRLAVIVGKTGGCNKTARGAQTHAVLASVLQTLKQQEGERLEYLVSVLTASADPPKLLSPPIFDTS